MQFTGIPNFAPDLFRRARLRDPLRLKALQKGLLQLSEEGATQLFRPLLGNDLILGAVGVLQFEVVAYRLQNEYNVNAMFENVNIHTARWVQCDDRRILADFRAQLQNNLALDAAGVGPSTPACTGLVLSALVDVGLHDTPTARRAVDYLLARQEADGTWPNASYLATNIPPSGFYAYAGAVRQVPLEALARFRRQLSPSSEAGSRAESAAV